MDLPASAISEFKTIFESEFKRPLSDDEAHERAEAFMRVVVLILRPLSIGCLAINGAPPTVDGLAIFDTLARNPQVTPKSKK